jgi:hypothetical protein
MTRVPTARSSRASGPSDWRWGAAPINAQSSTRSDRQSPAGSPQAAPPRNLHLYAEPQPRERIAPLSLSRRSERVGEQAAGAWIGRAGALSAPTRDTAALRCVSRREPTLTRRARTSSVCDDGDGADYSVRKRLSLPVARVGMLSTTVTVTVGSGHPEPASASSCLRVRLSISTVPSAHTMIAAPVRVCCT